jgi:hypothetical protein
MSMKVMIQSHTRAILLDCRGQNIGVFGAVHPYLQHVNRIKSPAGAESLPHPARVPGPAGWRSCNAVDTQALIIYTCCCVAQHLV